MSVGSIPTRCTIQKRENMNEENLIPNSERTPSERRELARRAGIASGEARRQKRTMREIAREVLHTMVKRNDGTEIEKAVLIANKLAMDAAQGNTKAAKLLVDWSGEAPTKQEITGEDGAPLIPRDMEQAKRMLEQE